MPTKIAITGATGLLGANLARAALDAGHQVVATKRATSKIGHLKDLEITWREASLSDPASLVEAFQGADIVFHCAASTSVLPRPTPALIAANVTGTQMVLQAIREAGVRRLVHTSSTVAIGVSDNDIPCTEAQVWNLAERGLDDGYATTKHQSEEEVLKAVATGGIDAVIVNPGFMFGPYDNRPSSGAMILEVASGRAAVHTPGRNSFACATNVAQGMLAAGERGRTGERYILGGENLTYGEVFARIAAVVGRSPPKFAAPRWVARFAGLAGDAVQWGTGKEQSVTSTTVAWGFERGFIADSSKAIDELGYDPGSLDDGIRACWSWFRQEGRV